MKNQILILNLAKRICILCLVVGFLWIGAASVNAHRVNVFAWIEGDTVNDVVDGVAVTGDVDRLQHAVGGVRIVIVRQAALGHVRTR